MSLYDQADRVDANNTGVTQDPPLTEGDYPELAVLKIEEFRPSTAKHCLYWKLRGVVVSGPSKGAIFSILEQLEGTTYPEHATQAMARVKKLIGQLFGLSDVNQINTQVTGQVIRGCFANDGKIMAGKVFGATVSHKISKGKGKVIAKFDTRVSAGAKEVDVSAAQVASDARDAQFTKTPSAPPPTPPGMAAPPPAAFVPPPAAAPTFPPAGWQAHPSAPDQYFKAGMTKCITGTELRVLAAGNMA